MKLTVNQAIEELKRIRQDEENDNYSAIEKRYGTLENSWKATARIREFITGCGYCSHCYEKQNCVEDIEAGMCAACYQWEENNYLFGDI